MLKKPSVIDLLLSAILVTTLSLPLSMFIPSAAGSPGLIADNPEITVQGTQHFNFAAWGGWWVRGSSTGVEFKFTGINTATIPGSIVRVSFELAVSNHKDGDFGLDGLVDITINPGVTGWTYTIPNVLFDNVDRENHLAAWGDQTYESYDADATIYVNKKYVRAGTLIIKVHRHVDVLDFNPSVTTCTYAPIDMSTIPPTVPTGCYDYNDAHTVHIHVATTDASGTVAADGEVTIWETPSGVGGLQGPIDKLGLVAPYIGIASTILIATAIYVKRVKRRREK
jgi:hypothetical protein